jgi:hypothetical protein
MEDFRTIFCSSDFPGARERISSTFIDNLGTRPQKKNSLPYEFIQPK